MSAATVTGEAIRQGLVERGDWLFIGQATATGTTSYIVDITRLKGAHISSALFANCLVRIPGSGARSPGEQVGVDYIDNVNGYLYVQPTLSAALQSGDTYEVWLRGINPDIVDRLRDDCLQKFASTWRVEPICIVADGDMDASGVTHWTAAGGATRTKAFSGFPNAHGRRELQVVHTTASTDYVESDPVDCQPNERIFLQVPVRAYVTATPESPATASIVAWDKTNSAAITLGGLKQTQTGVGEGFISLLFTIPAGCYRFTLRLKSDTDASTTAWGPMNCHKRTKFRYSFPDRITTKKRVGSLYCTNSINPATSEIQDYVLKLPDFTNVNRVQNGSQVELYVQPAFVELAYFYAERGYFDRLSTDYLTASGRAAGDAATTDCQKEYIVAKLAAHVSKWMLDKFGADWQDDWVRASQDDNYWEGEMGPEPRFVHDNETPTRVVNLRV